MTKKFCKYCKSQLKEVKSIREERQRIWDLVALMPHARKEELDIIKKKIFEKNKK